MAVVLASVFALPLAAITTRFEFRGALLVQTLGFVPLIMPPFVGAVAMQLLFGRNGTVNLLLDDWLGVKIPFMEGLNGVVFVQSVHYFPFILVNLSAALRNIDRSMEEAAQNLGSSGFSPLPPHRLPARAARASGGRLARVREGVRRPRDAAPPQRQGHAGPAGLPPRHLDRHRGPHGLRDLGGAHRRVHPRHVGLGRRHAGPGLRHRAARRRRPRPARMRVGRALSPMRRCFLILALVLAPHLGLLLLSFATVWSFSPAADGFTLAHYGRVFGESFVYIKNTLLYASLAGVIDVVLGAGIAYLVLRTRLVGRAWLDWAASAALAVPGVVLGIGYLRTFYGVQLPTGARSRLCGS
jgi:iron(III) transport system permease protein